MNDSSWISPCWSLCVSKTLSTTASCSQRSVFKARYIQPHCVNPMSFSGIKWLGSFERWGGMGLFMLSPSSKTCCDDFWLCDPNKWWWFFQSYDMKQWPQVRSMMKHQHHFSKPNGTLCAQSHSDIYEKSSNTAHAPSPIQYWSSEHGHSAVASFFEHAWLDKSVLLCSLRTPLENMWFESSKWCGS